MAGFGRCRCRLAIAEKAPRANSKDDMPLSENLKAGIGAEQHLRLLIDAVKDYAIFMLDPQGKITSWNQGAERVKGYRAAEIIGKHFSCFYPEEDARSGKPQRELEIAAREGSFEQEGWRVRKDGSRFWADVGLAAAVQWFLDGFSQHTGIRAHLEAPADLGRLPEEKEISLFRVVQECLTNIHRHANSQTALVRMHIRDEKLTLEVIDRGTGFTPEFAEGIGIRGMRERLHELGGNLEIASTATGSTVRATVPIAGRQKAAESAAKTKVRLLLVDDHEVVRQGLASLLQGVEGFEICGQAASGEDAIREADRSVPDIVIMDLRLPGIDGLQATRSILKAHPQTDVLIFTVDQSEQVLREALKAGARGCLTKTDAGSSLLSMLKTLVAERHPHPGAN